MQAVLERQAEATAGWAFGRPTRRTAIVAACAAMVGVSVWMRIWRLDWVPGLNGDEAWYGVQAEKLLDGEPFSWRTPTGNPLNPLFFGMMVALHSFGGPSIALLRAPAVLSGITALALNFWLCRRVFDARTAAASTVALAILPVNIVYSRFAWDASQSLLATVVVMYVSLLAAAADGSRRRRLLAVGAAAVGGAALVHPTNVFILPLLVTASVVGHTQAIVQTRRWRLVALAGLAVSGILLLPYAATISQRVCKPSEYGAFIGNFVGLLSGSTVLEFIPGSIAPSGELDLHRAIYDVPMAIVVVTALWGAFRLMKGRSAALERCLGIGWAACVIGFFAVAGARAIRPHWERYGIWLVAPTVLLATRGALWCWDRIALRQRAAAWLVIAAGWLLLAGFFCDYFVYFARTGGTSHVAFRTARPEPKLAALRLILKQQPAGSPVSIVADDWWTYWPLAYLAADKPGVEVSARGVAGAKNGVLGPKSATSWYVRFIEGSEASHNTFPNASPDSPGSKSAVGGQSARWIVPDESGSPLLEVSR